MKLISLNTWGGKLFEPLLKFVSDQSSDTDIFCFQEVFDSPKDMFHNGIKTNLYSDFKKILSGYRSFYAPMFTGYDTEVKVDFPLSFGQATFVKKGIQIVSEETIFVHGKFDHKPPVELEGIEEGLDLPRNMLCLKIRENRKELLIANFHGYWNPGSKKDNPERILQSKKIKKYFSNLSVPVILCGDFNLKPDTQSLRMLEEDMKNLIKDFGIKGTRTHHYKKTDERYADYILVSEGVKANSFEVPETVVSDHLPMILEFAI